MMKDKRKINRNNSFSGVELKKSPVNRRKSISTALPTPAKKVKKVKRLSQWIVSESSPENTLFERKQLVIEDTTEDEDGLEVNRSLLKTSKIVSPTKKLLERVGNKQNSDIELEANETEKFGFKPADVIKAVKTVIELHSKNSKLQNQLFEDSIPLYLQVNCNVVPRGPSRIIRIPLPNSLLSPEDEICLIVPDVKTIKNIDHEKHVEHYENLLQNKGVTNIKKIMTFHEFRTEYETFEQKLRLVDLYDKFLVDGRISGKVVNKSGKIFYKKRKVPTSIRLQTGNLKQRIDKALSKTHFMLHLKGNSYNVQFGHNKMQIEELVDNVFATVEYLNIEFPGGFDNFKGIYVKAVGTTSIPIYLSFKKPKEIQLPKVKSKKPKAFKTYKDELTTLPNAKVVVKPSGKVFVKRIKDEEEKINKQNTSVESADKITNVKKKKRKQSEPVPTESAKKTKIEENEIEVEVNSDEKIAKKKIKGFDVNNTTLEKKRRSITDNTDKPELHVLKFKIKKNKQIKENLEKHRESSKKKQKIKRSIRD